MVINKVIERLYDFLDDLLDEAPKHMFWSAVTIGALVAGPSAVAYLYPRTENARPIYAVMAEQVDARVYRAEDAAISETFHKGQLVRVWDDLWEPAPSHQHWYSVSWVTMDKGRIAPDTRPDVFGTAGSWVRAEHLNFLPICSP